MFLGIFDFCLHFFPLRKKIGKTKWRPIFRPIFKIKSQISRNYGDLCGKVQLILPLEGLRFPKMYIIRCTSLHFCFFTACVLLSPQPNLRLQKWRENSNIRFGSNAQNSIDLMFRVDINRI